MYKVLPCLSIIVMKTMACLIVLDFNFFAPKYWFCHLPQKSGIWALNGTKYRLEGLLLSLSVFILFKSSVQNIAHLVQLHWANTNLQCKIYYSLDSTSNSL